MRVLVTGATGLIGGAFLEELSRAGHEASALARTPGKLKTLPKERVFEWSDDQKAPAAAFRQCDAVVHLAGEPIADKRWTAERKKRLRDSRILGTENLIAGMRAHPPKVLIAGSAIGYYGDTGDRPADENSRAGSGFLAELVQDWEKAALEAEKLGTRVVLIRTGLVLARDGGALAKMPPIPVGNGKQWMSWVHLHDLVRFLLFSLTHEAASGPFNLVTPHPVRNREFASALAQAKGLPFASPVGAPAFALKLALGEMAEMLLESQKVLPHRTEKSGFRFEHPRLKEALSELFSRP